MRFSMPTLIAALLITAPLIAQDSGPLEIRAENCMVQYINKVDIPAKAEGSLTLLKFEEGDTVTEGDVIAVIDDTAAKLAVELKKAEYKEAILTADNDVNLEDAKNSAKLAKAESEAYKELRREGAIPFWEMEKKNLEAKRQDLRIKLAEMEQKVVMIKMIGKGSELEMAEFELTKRSITSPATGFIETRIAQLGQWVQAGSPIATLIQMDKLRVEGDVDALRYAGQIMQGTPVEVLVYNQSDTATKVNGKLGYVSMEIDLNNRHRVWVELENKKVGNDWVIKPGMRAEIIIRKSGKVY